MHPVFLVSLARAGFVALCCLLGISLALGFGAAAWVGALAGTGFGLLIVLIDVLLKNVSIRGFSSATFGLMIGIFCAWLITRVGIFDSTWFQSLDNQQDIQRLAELMIYISLGFLGITLAVRSDQEEFSFIIPYVRFRREGAFDQPILLDTNVIIDGRVEAIYDTGFLNGTLIIPQFVLDELQLLADSKDTSKGERGRAGLESLRSLQKLPEAEVTIYADKSLQPGEHVDAKIIALARLLGARILTNDVNLGQVAKLQKVNILNLNSLAKALHPTVITGDEITIALSKTGREEHQAIGYLSDGTMIVVNEGVEMIGKEVPVRITTSLQTSAGRLVFAELI